MQIIQSIQNRIYEIRGEKLILDRDVAASDNGMTETGLGLEKRVHRDF